MNTRTAPRLSLSLHDYGAILGMIVTFMTASWFVASLNFATKDDLNDVKSTAVSHTTSITHIEKLMDRLDRNISLLLTSQGIHPHP